MDQKTHDISALLMALDDFRNYSAAKVEVYEEALKGLGFSPGALRSMWKPDRGRTDEWKAKILNADDRYPEEK